eukprot:jgi/Ulvmu1/2456/UM136_0008.1
MLVTGGTDRSPLIRMTADLQATTRQHGRDAVGEHLPHVIQDYLLQQSIHTAQHALGPTNPSAKWPHCPGVRSQAVAMWHNACKPVMRAWRVQYTHSRLAQRSTPVTRLGTAVRDTCMKSTARCAAAQIP